MLNIPMQMKKTILEFRDRGAIFFLNHSGGKDSQCMTLTIRELVPESQLVVIHAHLPGVEWPGTRKHIHDTIGNIEYIEVVARKTFFEMVEHRQKFPSPAQRQCTSDLKRGPIETAIRRYSKSTGNTLIVSCMGIRAEESSNRSKMKAFRFSERNSKAGREWYDMLPIHRMMEDEVFQVIRRHQQEPHWAYKAGMNRLSCCFCIMASPQDLKVAATLNPELYRKYVETERRLDFTVSMTRKFLPEITGISIQQVKENIEI